MLQAEYLSVHIVWRLSASIAIWCEHDQCEAELAFSRSFWWDSAAISHHFLVRLCSNFPLEGQFQSWQHMCGLKILRDVRSINSRGLVDGHMTHSLSSNCIMTVNIHVECLLTSLIYRSVGMGSLTHDAQPLQKFLDTISCNFCHKTGLGLELQFHRTVRVGKVQQEVWGTGPDEFWRF